MSKREVNKSTDKYTFNFKWCLYIPIILLLTIVPLFMRLSIQELDGEVAEVFRRFQVYDFFSQYKAGLILVLTGIILVILFLTFSKTKVKWNKSIKIYILGAVVFLIGSIISTLLSDYTDIAIWGAPDRAEGMLIIGAYVIIMLYSMYILDTTKNIKFIVIPLSILTCILGILGIFQYFGKDLILSTDIGKSLIIPKEYENYRNSLVPLYEKGKIYGTLFHYNYVGSFAAMMLPLYTGLTIYYTDKKKKVLCILMMMISMFLLFGSTSRAGLIGVCGSVLIFVLLEGRVIFRNWKKSLGILCLGVIVLLGLDQLTGGAIYSRIPMLVNDIATLFKQDTSEKDYKEYLPIRDIFVEDNYLNIVAQKGTLKLSLEEEKLVFKDEKNEVVPFIFDNETFTTKDERFKQFSLLNTPTTDASIKDGLILKVDGESCFMFKVDLNQGIYLIDTFTAKPIELGDPEVWGFKGKEKMGSSRGYIWSRSLPLLKDTWLVGYGPDTYILEFPQDDYLGKWYAYGTTEIIVDKPHNLYLQIAINNGGIALIGFVVLIIGYVVCSIRLYVFKQVDRQKGILGMTLLLSIVGYLGAGMFNDSIVSVAPIFWILLGTGIAVNFIVEREYNLVQKALPHAVIDMKKRK